MENVMMNYDEINSVYNAIKELYLNYCEELENDKKKLEILCNQIKENKEYIQYLENHQNSDTYVFSPRGVLSKNNVSGQEGIYDTGKLINFSDTQKKQDELAALEEEKFGQEEKIKKLESSLALLERNKNILKKLSVLELEKKNDKIRQEELTKELDEKKKSLYQSLKDGPLSRLSYTIHMIEMIYTFIDNDPVRAKLEITNIKNDLQLLMHNIEITVGVPEGENL